MTRLPRIVAIVMLTLGSSLVAAPAAQAGGGRGCGPTPFTDEATTTVRTRGSCFAPTVARVPVGGKVVWTSDDSYDHAVAPVAEGFLPTGYLLDSRNQVTATFERPGVYPYVCPLHPTMAGAVVVGDGGGAPQASASIFDDGDRSAAAAGLGIAGLAVLAIAALPRLARRRSIRAATAPPPAT